MGGKETIMKSFFLILFMAVIFFLSSCGSSGTPDAKHVIPVTEIRLNTSSLNLTPRITEQLTAIIEPSDATNKTVTWSSSDSSVAVVYSNGSIYAAGAGTATISVTTADGGYSAQCTVTVTMVDVTGVHINSESLVLSPGTIEQLVATIEPATAINKKVAWSSDNASVATVSSGGIVSAVAVGSATIAVTTDDGGYTAHCGVTVAIGVTGVFLNKDSMTLRPGMSEQLSATLVPSNATNQTVTWSSSNTSVATVSAGGIVTAVGGGLTTIRVISGDGGYTGQCTVNVIVDVTGIRLNKDAMLLSPGTSEILRATIEPFDATNKTVTWSSSDTAVATVSEQGLVSGISLGSATITVTTDDGAYTAQCDTTVLIRVTDIHVNKHSITLTSGMTEQLAVTFEPSYATNQAVMWSSSDSSVATVSSDGSVTSVSEGEALITVMAEDGGHTDECHVYVCKAFITTWNTTLVDEYDFANPTDSNQIQLPLDPYGIFDFVVSWGDETSDHITAWDQAETLHTYAVEGTYDVEMFGRIEGFGFSTDGFTAVDNTKLLDVKQWGTVKLHNNGRVFYHTMNLTGFSALDNPDLSNITNMNHMFASATAFNGEIGGWDVSHVTSMEGLFSNAQSFNQPIGDWIVDNVTKMKSMFKDAHAFNQEIGGWHVDNVTDMDSMFCLASSFDQNIGEWNVGNVTTMIYMFDKAYSFNQDIGTWDVLNVKSMGYMFVDATSFNQDISNWKVNNVTYMRSMFDGATAFNQPIGGWNVGNVWSMREMFSGAVAFNQSIGRWDVGNVTTMRSMFYDARLFNQDLHLWNVSKVNDMYQMFCKADAFNGNITDWNVSNVTKMSRMFMYNDAFNQNIAIWEVFNATDLSQMFYLATTFDQDLEAWIVNEEADMTSMFTGSGLDGNEPSWYTP